MTHVFRSGHATAAILALATFALAAFSPTAPAAAQQGAGPDRLVTVVTAGEPQTQLMAMVLTMQAVKQGADAYVLLCGPGGDLGLKAPPAAATAPQAPKGMSPQGLMRRLMKAGATVAVCAIYLPNREADASVLIDGVGVAKPGPMAERLMAPRTRVLGF